MPALPPAPGVVKIIVKQTLGGVNVFNVLHASAGDSSGYTQDTLQRLATAVRSAWVTNVIPLQGSKMTLGDVTVQDLWADTAGEASQTGTTVGAQASTLPANVAVCWSWKIARRYRGGHPRTYIAAIPYAHELEPNSLTSTARTSHQNAAGAVRAAVNAVLADDGVALFQLGQLSYYKGKNADGTPALRPSPLFDGFTGVSVDDRLDSQRRRLGRDR